MSSFKKTREGEMGNRRNGKETKREIDEWENGKESQTSHKKSLLREK